MAVSIKNPDRNRFSVSVCRSLVPPHFKGGESDRQPDAALNVRHCDKEPDGAALGRGRQPSHRRLPCCQLHHPKAVDNENSASAYICKFFVWLIFKGESEM